MSDNPKKSCERASDVRRHAALSNTIDKLKLFLLHALSWVSVRWHPRGTERLLRIAHHPDKRRNFAIRVQRRYFEGRCINIDTSSFCEWKIYFYGYYEESVARFLAANAKQNDIVVEVGANIGSNTIILSERVGPGGKVIAYEPSPAVLPKLRRNLALNTMSNVFVVESAVSDQCGYLPLYIPKGCIGTNDMNASLLSGELSEYECVNVPVVTLDHEVTMGRIHRPSLLKIDTEGNDFAVLRGAINLISKWRPTILFECSSKNDCWERDLSLLASRLSDLNYKLWLLDERKFRLLNLAGISRSHTCDSDIVAIPNDRL